MSALLTEAAVVSKPPDKNRWYLCTETEKQAHWTCKEVTNPDGVQTNPRTIAVQIPHWSPRMADMIFINDALKQTFSIER